MKRKLISLVVSSVFLVAPCAGSADGRDTDARTAAGSESRSGDDR